MAERKRIAVPISGIDTSTPNHSVTDGKCETLHNLRYTGEAWRNVKEFEEKNRTIPEGYKIVYHHPMDTSNVYICEVTNGKNKSLYRVSFYNETNNSKSLIQTLDTSHSYIYSHFGSILIIGDVNSKKNYYHILSNESYKPYVASQGIDIDCQYDLGDPIKSKKAELAYGNDAITEPIFTENNPAYPNGIANLSTHQDSSWRGEILCIVTVEDYASNILGISSPLIINTCQTTIDSYIGDYGWCKAREIIPSYNEVTLPAIHCVYNGDTRTFSLAADSLNSMDASAGNTNNPEEYRKSISDIRNLGTPYMRFYTPKLTISINHNNYLNAAQKGFIVKIWSSRIYPLFDVEAIKDKADYIETKIEPEYIKDYFADNQLFDEPLYLISRIDSSNKIKENEPLELEQVIDGGELENAVHSPLYTATISHNNLFAKDNIEYNNRVHLISPYNRVDNTEAINATTSPIATDYNYMKVVYEKNGADYFQPIYPNSIKSSAIGFAKIQNKFILTAERIVYAIGFVDDDDKFVSSFPMRLSSSLGISYFVNRTKDYNLTISYKINTKPYKDIELDRDDRQTLKNDVTYVRNVEGSQDKNRIQVSELNSPFSYPYDNSYYVGSGANAILAINSGAIEMSDSKFGEFPLYVFTKEGIFAMQSGKDTLYSAIIPINYDVIINPNTLAVNGAVLYFTDKGLHALTNQGAKLLSAPMHTAENRIPEWMYTTQMVYLPEWNEVLCTDLPNKKAYVFSLDSNVWSTRDISEGYILNNDELVATDDVIYNLRNEKEQGSDGISIALTTRPIKLGSMELKRAETIIVRFECETEQTLNVKVEGSIDTQNWGELRNIQTTTNKDVIIRRTPCSVKYLRFTIEGNVTDDIRILAFELEYYERMRHRMR